MKRYSTIDNGGCIFFVYISKDKITINLNCNSLSHCYENVREIEMMTIHKYNKVFIGEDDGSEKIGGYQPYMKKYSGNSILINTKGNEYLFIGHVVAKFIAKDKIKLFKSPIGNSAVPYTFGVDNLNNIYMFSQIPHEIRHYSKTDLKRLKNSISTITDVLPILSNKLYMKNYMKFNENYKTPYDIYYHLTKSEYLTIKHIKVKVLFRKEQKICQQL